jgi:hypothetical protein
MLVDERLQQLRDLAPALAPTHEHHGLAGVPVRRPEVVASGGLLGRGDHDLLALG